MLLGPYKYLLRNLIPRLTMKHKQEIKAILSTFNFSGMEQKLDIKLIKHYKSFVGRNFKSLAQCALFIFRNYFQQMKRKFGLLCQRLESLFIALFYLRLNDIWFSKSHTVTHVLSHKRKLSVSVQKIC